jgi:hypothetical protein
MNYIEQINGFWDKSRTDDLTAIDVSTYMSILDYCNSLGWMNPFICHWDIVCQRSKSSKNAFYKSVDRLNELGYIKFEKGNRSTKQPKLTVLELKNTEGTRKEYKGNTEGTPKEHEGNLYKQLNLETIKLIEANASLVEENLEEWIKNSKKNVSSRPKTVKEVEDYMTEIGYPNPLFESQQFFDHYEANGWMRGRNGKNKIKDWKAVVRTWHRRKEKDDKVVRNEYGSAVGQKGDREALAKYMGITVEELDKIKPIY